MQTDQIVYIFPEKAGTRNGCHTDIFDHPLAELQIGISGKLRQIQELLDIDHDKIRSLRHIVLQTDRIQTF